MPEDIPIFGCIAACGAGLPMLRILASAGGRSRELVGAGTGAPDALSIVKAGLFIIILSVG
jgi:hypothetical protein